MGAIFAVATAFALAGVPDVAVRAADDPRLRTALNDGWRYADGPIDNPQAPDFHDGDWARVDLPHTWNTDGAFDGRDDYRRGEGWYRRTLALDRGQRQRRLFVYFEGANQVAELFVNGASAGTHVGGYTAFAFEITDLVRFDAPNVLAVRVDNAHDPDVPPLNADFTFFGGIYRDVWLIDTDPVHIDVLDHASPGVFVDTPEVSAGGATVRARGTVVNRSPARQRIDVRHRVIDPDGREVAAFGSRIGVPAGGRASFEATSPSIARPRLWSPASPALYRVATEIRSGEVLLDRVDVPLGFRWFTADAQRGFFLNGRPYPLHGSNRHQDLAGRGNALRDAEHRHDVRLVKETGFNFLRLAHYPQDPAVLEETDALGLAVWEEIPVVNLITPSRDFADNAERMLVEMIRQHYNHPSVLMWGYMNEVMQFRPDPEPPGYEAALLALARRLEARARAEDPGRLTATAISFTEVDNGSGFQDIPQVLGLNLYFGWYYETLDGLGPYLDALHARHPERPLLISEYGAGSDERIHAREPVAFDFSTEFQQRFHESSFAQLAARTYLVGSAVWNQFDFASAGRQDSKPGLNQKGLSFHDRRPKDALQYYRARLADADVLHIAVRDRAYRAGSRPEDARQTVTVYGNLDGIELLHDGVPVGSARPSNAVARFEVTLHDGVNRLQAHGRRDGRRVTDVAEVMYEDRAPLFSGAPSDHRGIAVNAGGDYAVVSDGMLVWEPDQVHAPGSWGAIGGRALRSHHRISGGDEPLWQAARLGADGYRFDVPEGEYELRLLFVELEHERGGQRVFDVEVNGQPVATALDLAAGYGRYTAVERAIRVRAGPDAGVAVRLRARAGETTISGILLRRL